ncbi:MAG: helix-turn-helix transcriptional regulator, partial [Pseudomonadota bacterium]
HPWEAGRDNSPDWDEAMASFDPGAVEAYQAHYASVNPYMNFNILNNQQTIFTARDVVSVDQVIKGEFYNDWLKNQRPAPAGIGLLLAREDNQIASICFNLTLEDEASKQDDLRALLLRISNPVRFAIEARRHAIKADKNFGSAEKLIDEFPFGVAAIGPDRRVRYMNQRLSEILEQADGLNYHQSSGLTASDPRSDADLSESLGLLNSQQDAQPFAINRPNKSIPYVAAVFRGHCDSSPASLRRLLGGVDNSALLIVVDPSVHKPAQGELLQQVFGLTAAEAKLSAALGTGADLTSFAEGNQISRYTARNQLSSALSKLGLRRQSDLVALVNRLHLPNGV